MGGRAGETVQPWGRDGGWPTAAQEDTHDTEKRGHHGPAVLHPGPRPVADHVLNTIVEIITACKSQRQTDSDLASQMRRPPREP